jgi:hypothetical protein
VKADAAAVLRVDLDAIVQLLADDYAVVEPFSRNLLEVDQMLTQFEDGLHYVEVAYDEMKKYVGQFLVPSWIECSHAFDISRCCHGMEGSLRFQRFVLMVYFLCLLHFLSHVG